MSHTQPLTLKQRALLSEKRIYQWATATIIVIALSAAILSYDALRSLAVQSQIPVMFSFLFPVIVDGLILSGSLLTLHNANYGRISKYGVFLTGLGVLGSIGGNIAVSPNNLVAQIVHAAPPLILFLALEAFTLILRDKHRQKLLHGVNVPTKTVSTSTMTPISADSNAPAASKSPNVNIDKARRIASESGRVLPVGATNNKNENNPTVEKNENKKEAVGVKKNLRETIRERILAGEISVEELIKDWNGDIKYGKKIAREEIRKHQNSQTSDPDADSPTV